MSIATTTRSPAEDQASRLRSMCAGRTPGASASVVAVISGAPGSPTWALAECFRGVWCDEGVVASVIDCGHGEDGVVRAIGARPSACVVLATPDLGGLTGAYAVLKALALGVLPGGVGAPVQQSPMPRVRQFAVVPSGCQSPSEALDVWSRVSRTAAAFLGIETAWAGWLPAGPAWEEATVDLAHRLRGGLGGTPRGPQGARRTDGNCASG